MRNQARPDIGTLLRNRSPTFVYSEPRYGTDLLELESGSLALVICNDQTNIDIEFSYVVVQNKCTGWILNHRWELADRTAGRTK